MINRSSLTSLASARWGFLVLSVVTASNACAPRATTPAATAAVPQSGMGSRSSSSIAIPGVPNLPDVVTVVPFYSKENETEKEKTKVVIPAEVDGLHSIFILDLGCPPLMLNRTFLQPSSTGGIDTVTDANRIPDKTTENDPSTFDKVHVTMRIGTLLVKFDDPSMQGPYNALLGHEWGNFGWILFTTTRKHRAFCAGAVRDDNRLCASTPHPNPTGFCRAQTG